jgi:hypothetical protein
MFLSAQSDPTSAVNSSVKVVITSLLSQRELYIPVLFEGNMDVYADRTPLAFICEQRYSS